jgi:hypothetical protein
VQQQKNLKEQWAVDSFQRETVPYVPRRQNPVLTQTLPTVMHPINALHLNDYEPLIIPSRDRKETANTWLVSGPIPRIGY